MLISTLALQRQGTSEALRPDAGSVGVLRGGNPRLGSVSRCRLPLATITPSYRKRLPADGPTSSPSSVRSSVERKRPARTAIAPASRSRQHARAHTHPRGRCSLGPRTRLGSRSSTTRIGSSRNGERARTNSTSHRPPPRPAPPSAELDERGLPATLINAPSRTLASCAKSAEHRAAIWVGFSRKFAAVAPPAASRRLDNRV